MGEKRGLYAERGLTQESMALANEVRLSCTTAMLLSMDRDHRIAFVLGVVFELDGNTCSKILDITPTTFRKRLERARHKLDGWMQRQCGLVNASAGCSCIRQVVIATENNHIDPANLMYSEHPVTTQTEGYLSMDGLRSTSDQALVFARVLLDHPNYCAPEPVTENLRSMIANRDLQIFH
jgi:hypothetical protein